MPQILIDLDPKTEKAMEDLCSFYGVSLSDAAKALCKQAIKEKILPVKCPKSRTPNAETLAAIAEGEKMLKDPDKYARYYTDEEIKQGLYRK